MANNNEESPMSADATVSPEVPSKYVDVISGFFSAVGAVSTIRPEHNVKDSFSNLVGGCLKVISIERGKISCLLTVKPQLLNPYGGMHGGSVGAVSATVAVACARTVVGEDKDLFLGELNIAYLAAAPPNAQVVIDGSVIRSGRNLSVVSLDFQLKKTGRLAFRTRATFYHMPASRL